MLFNNLIFNFDAPTSWGLFFQDSATPSCEGLIELHNNILYYLVLILFGVAWVLFSIVYNFIEKKAPVEKWWGKLLLWELTLSNSGNILKLFILNLIFKYFNSQIKNIFKVKGKKICENIMDNRGSKLAKDKSMLVKEQRVDGSGQELLFNISSCLRCTLMGFERNYQVNNLSKQINKRFFSSINTNETDPTEFNLKMNPWFLTGFADGEASFILYIQKTSNTKIGWATWLAFEIN